MERKIEKEKERDSFGILYTDYLSSVVKIKREREKKRKERKLSLVVVDKNSTKKGWQKNLTLGKSSDFKRFENANQKI